MRLRNTKNLSIMLLFVLVLSLGLSTVSLASASVPREPNSNNRQNSYGDTSFDTGIPNTTIDEASSWVERKGFEVVGFLQRFVQPFAIIIFIGCSILTLLGAFGNGRLVSRGFLGMLISLVMYVVTLYAPEIMDIFLGWVMS